jgi:hypothetical protein
MSEGTVTETVGFTEHLNQVDDDFRFQGDLELGMGDVEGVVDTTSLLVGSLVPVDVEGVLSEDCRERVILGDLVEGGLEEGVYQRSVQGVQNTGLVQRKDLPLVPPTGLLGHLVQVDVQKQVFPSENQSQIGPRFPVKNVDGVHLDFEVAQVTT